MNGHMTIWEYYQEAFMADTDPNFRLLDASPLLDARMQALGQLGWELTAVIHVIDSNRSEIHRLFFKREKGKR
jgi:hypothetical protein